MGDPDPTTEKVDSPNQFNKETESGGSIWEKVGTFGGKVLGAIGGAALGTAIEPGAGTAIGEELGKAGGGAIGGELGREFNEWLNPEIGEAREKQKQEREDWQAERKRRDKEQYELDKQEREARIKLLGADISAANRAVNDLNKSYVPPARYKREVDYDPDFYLKQDEAKMLAQKQEAELKAKKARRKAKKAAMTAQEKEYYDKVKALKLKGIEQEIKAKEDALKEKSEHLKLKNAKEQERKDIILQRTKDVGKKKKSKDKAYYKAKYGKKEEV